MEDAIDIAVDNPTLQNVMRAQRIQKIVMDKAEALAQQWVRVALVDDTLESENPNHLHRTIQKQEKEKNQLKILQEMAQNFGLFFYVQESCVYCQTFLPIVKELSQETGFQVLAISNSGQNFGPFEGAPDTGLLDFLNPKKISPTLFLVSRDGKKSKS